MRHKHSLFRYYDDERWAAAFLSGDFRFRSLAHFRDLEDKGVRGDANEGRAMVQPSAGLEITNQRTGAKHRAVAMTSTARQREIFVFCLSRSLSAELWDEFGAVACIEILDVPEFCARVARSLPAGARFPGRPGHQQIGNRVECLRRHRSRRTRYALPDLIASSKVRAYQHQDEFRLIFSLTDALEFQNAAMELVLRGTLPVPRPVLDHAYHDARVGSLADICRVRVKPAPMTRRTIATGTIPGTTA